MASAAAQASHPPGKARSPVVAGIAMCSAIAAAWVCKLSPAAKARMTSMAMQHLQTCV
jgi:hypothetical protein